jgi:hypothetical protein
MRILEAIAKQGQKALAKTEAQDAETRIARLQHIAMLQVKATQVIEAAEAALDESLFACPSLDESGDGTLHELRNAHYAVHLLS